MHEDVHCSIICINKNCKQDDQYQGNDLKYLHPMEYYAALK